jgi:hypothetical protein
MASCLVCQWQSSAAKWTSLSTASKNIMPYMQTDRSLARIDVDFEEHYKVFRKLATLGRDFSKLPPLTTRKFP